MKREGWFWEEMEGRRELAPCSRLLGRQVRAVDPEAGTIEVEFEAAPEFVNSAGAIQGGMLAAMLDSTLGLALRARLPADVLAPTLELKVSFLRPATVGPLVGQGRVVHQATSVAFLAGELRNPAGEIVATASATARLRRAKS